MINSVAAGTPRSSRRAWWFARRQHVPWQAWAPVAILALITIGLVARHARTVDAPLPARPLVTDGVDVPHSGTVLSGQTASTIVQLARWGYGTANIVQFSADGRWLLVGSASGLQVYDGHTRQFVQAIDTGTPVQTLTIAPDNQRVAIAGPGTTVWVWRIADGTLLQTVRGRARDATHLAWSPDGATIASAADDDAVRLWRVWDGLIRRELRGPNGPASHIAFASDGAMLAASVRNSVWVWNVADRTVRFQVGHTLRVEHVAWSPDGRTLATRANDQVYLWDATTGALRDMLDPANVEGSGALAWTSDGSMLAIVNGDTIQLWRVADLTLAQTLGGSSTMIDSMAFSPDGHTLALVSDGTVLVRDVAQDVALRSPSGYRKPMRSVAVAPDGSTIAARSDTRASLYAADGTVRRTLELQNEAAPIAWTHDGQAVATIVPSDTVTLWQADGTTRPVAQTPGEPINLFAFAPDGSTFVTAPLSGTLRLWRTGATSTPHTLSTFTSEDGVRSSAYRPHSDVLATGAENGSITLWRTADGDLVSTIEGTGKAAKALAFNPDGTLIAAAFSDNVVRVWRVGDAALLGSVSFDDTFERVTSMVWTPDSSALIMGSTDDTIRVLDPTTFAIRHTVRGHAGAVTNLALTPDGTMLVSSGDDGTVRWWGVPPP